MNECTPYDPRCQSTLTKHVYLAVKPTKESQIFEDYLDASEFLKSKSGDYIGNIHRLETVSVYQSQVGN